MTPSECLQLIAEEPNIVWRGRNRPAIDKCIERALPDGLQLAVTHIHSADLLQKYWKRFRVAPRYVTVAQLQRIEGANLWVVSQGRAICSHRDVPYRRRGYVIAVLRCLVDYEKKNGGQTA